MEPKRVVLVTGGARRVGAAIVRRLHEAGCDIALHYLRSEHEAAALASELQAIRPGSVVLFRADLADTSATRRLVDEVVARFGRLDGLVNNASSFYPTPVDSATPEQWDDLFAANARAPFFLAQAAAGELRRSRGAIVNIVDIYGERPLAEHPVYCMAKAALGMLTLSLAKDLAPDIRVNAVAPGAILWPDSGKDQAAADALMEKTPLARMGQPAEVAEAVRWLLLDANYTTGQTVRVDGGRALAI
ncbi:pteridine reductase [Luteibacter rhizovicinus]|uniref:Pteridine reductase n=1 Tax=Luteibacter rhizovicinus TaxID=242606 RepID=A0A4R3YWD7_9GAMM|nr:pteridine reductase [Luteibacter rhizovicinus]TCV96138.1 pteridine reductase [Luteibacter rhizovicinus]